MMSLFDVEYQSIAACARNWDGYRKTDTSIQTSIPYDYYCKKWCDWKVRKQTPPGLCSS